MGILASPCRCLPRANCSWKPRSAMEKHGFLLVPVLCAGNLQPSDPACAPGNALVKTCQDLSRGKMEKQYAFILFWPLKNLENTRKDQTPDNPDTALVVCHGGSAESGKKSAIPADFHKFVSQPD